MKIEPVIPWEMRGWDDYVRHHPAGNVYHTSSWCRIVAEIGCYTPRCWAAVAEDRIAGLLPAMEIRSRLTGNRLGSLPFSDASFPIADDSDTAERLVRAALDLREEQGLEFFEMRGVPVVPEGPAGDIAKNLGFHEQRHFVGYTLALGADTEAVRKTFSKKSVRQTINKSKRLGVTVRVGGEPDDLRDFYRLYVLNRKRHGIPPQPIRLFESILKQLQGDPQGRLYLAEHEGECIASLIVIRYKGVSHAKYEGIDETRRDVQPVYGLLWRSIEEACAAGDHAYDFGRTAADNKGLNEFKSRWGTTQVAVPYYFFPASEGLSVVQSASLKYRLFTAFFRRLPPGAAVRIGERIFRHFG